MRFNTLTEFQAYFEDEQKCRATFEALRFQNGDYCPYCSHGKINRFLNGKRYRCANCKKDFTIKTGTAFSGSKIPLKKWFLAIYLLSTSYKGASPLRLASQVGVTHKTAWFMDYRIRESLRKMGGGFPLEYKTVSAQADANQRISRKTGIISA